MSEPAAIPPDSKDWTWVLERPCDQCGLDAADLSLADLPDVLHTTAMAYADALRAPTVRERPDQHTWSVLEYACHVRDVHEVFAGRLRSMLDEEVPTFANWDQDATAVEERYAEQDPDQVAVALIEGAGTVAGLYAGVTREQAARRGVRSNGSEFTVETLGRYHLHDVVHHLHDIRSHATRLTRLAYDTFAADYAEATAVPPPRVVELVDRFAARLGEHATVLEVGSGPGRDARLLEERGLRVRRTDVSPGFVAVMRDAGLDADVLDPLVDELGGPYDGVWASATLLHVDRLDLPVVLGRLAGATRADGLLHLSVKEGDGDVWSHHGAVGAPRRFVLWREPALLEALRGSGWDPVEVGSADGLRGERWLEVLARREGP